MTESTPAPSTARPTPLPRATLDAIAREVTSELASRPLPRPTGEHAPRRMRVHVICYEDYQAWILGKFARRLVEGLDALGMQVTLGKEQDPSAEVNHHIIYFDYLERKSTLETVLITHIDDERELGKVRRQLIDLGVEMGVCMSYEAVRRLARFGVPRERLCFISPAHDGLIAPRKLLVGLTTRLYPDGCKREHLLAELCATISPAEFRFAIMGAGWGRIVGELRRRGFEVEYQDRFDAAEYRALIPTLDYYLYLGRDEGSMGYLDALAAGVPTIVTAQGFHLDVPGGITHPFDDLAGLRAIFEEIAAPRRRRIESVARMSWREHARQHALLWEYLLRKRRGEAIPSSLRTELDALAVAPDGPPAFRYERLTAWRRTASNGWAAPAVAARFVAGASGAEYLEHWPHGAALAGHPATRELLDLLARTGLERGALLDFGCGSAVLRDVLLVTGLAPRWSYVGVDVNPMNVEACRRRHGDCRFEQVTEGAPLPLPDRSVDVVVASGVLESVEDTRAALLELRRVTRDWLLLYRLPVRPVGPEALYWQAVRHAWGAEEHCQRIFDRAGLQATITAAGLEVAWSEVSEASGTWSAPDDPAPVQHFAYLLRRRGGPPDDGAP